MDSLKGVTILDISRLLPGGYASLLLCELGATVIKVEQPGVGDYYRALTADGQGLLASHTRVIHQGKQSLGLDLKTPEGKAVFKKLVRKADVVLESFRPGVLKKLKLDYSVLKKVKPSIILCSITGFGQTGPRSSLAGHDLNFLGLSGLLTKIRDQEGQCVIPDVQVTDLAAGMEAALKISAALYKRKKTKKGCWIDCSMIGAGYSFSRFCNFEKGPSVVSGGLIRYGVYETSDGRLVTLGALEEKFWSKFCHLIGHPAWIEASAGLRFLGEENREELRRIFRSKSLDQWTAFGLKEDICLFPVEEAIDLGRFSKKSPRLGEQTARILASIGYRPRDRRELKKKGVIE